ncbi:MAG: DMT family transporter [SAR202 cluster bacterium]|jgi:drug/metabolite transporter (DMT)-like permease|nr:DMT family transporter [SAR202 cluster bacterium]
MRFLTQSRKRPTALMVYAGLALGVSAVSSAAVLIRLADAPALTIAAYRLVLASIVVVPIGLATDWSALRSLTLKQWGLAAVSAACLAAHFAFWITSLEHTSVASSVIIVTANPILVAIGARLVLREAASPSVMVGIGMALFGGLVITVGDWDLGDRRLYGDFLAFLGAVAVAGYYIAGRSLRERLSLFGYIAPVYGGAAVILLVVVAVTGTAMTGFSLETYSYLALVGVLPQLVGHSSLNWSLGYLPATLVATAVMAEPVGATLLAWVVLDEAPPVATVAGGALVLSGVYVALRGR